MLNSYYIENLIELQGFQIKMVKMGKDARTIGRGKNMLKLPVICDVDLKSHRRLFLSLNFPTAEL